MLGAEVMARRRQEWAAHKRSTAPADRELAEDGVMRAYRAAGLAPPERIEWCDGPRDLVLGWWQSQGEREIGANVSWALHDQMAARAASTLRAGLDRTTRAQILASVPTRIEAATTSGVQEAIAFALSRRPAGTWTGGRLVRSWRHWLGRRIDRASLYRGFGQHELAALLHYELAGELLGPQACEPVRGLLKLARSVGWVLPHVRVCWLMERHNLLATDAQGRLHNAAGPAIAFRDGWSAEFWRGVRLPYDLVAHPGRISVRMIDREPDPVVRRCMIEIVTPERFVAMGGAVRIAEDEAGILWRRLWWGLDAWAAVEVVNGTPEPDGRRKRYFLQVPAHLRTAREAVAWTYGMSEQEYARLLVRT